MKKITTFAICFTLSNLLYAGSMGSMVVCDIDPKENFYAGVGIGGSFNKDTLKGISVYSTSVTKSPTQTVGNVYIGYGHTFMEKLFLGIEANTYFPGHTDNFITPGVSSAAVTNNYYTSQYNFKDYLGLDLLPGLRFNPNTLIYARTGLSFRDINISQNSTITAGPLSDSFYNAGHSMGGRFGAGVAYGLNKNIGVAVDYFYTYYPTFGSYWNIYNLQYNMTSNQNYVGASLIYTA